MLPFATKLRTFVLLTLLPATAVQAQSETERDFMAQVASVSPKGVAAGTATVNGVSMPILAFLNESTLDAFETKLKAKFAKTHILVPQATGSATGFLLVPQTKYPCATCTKGQLSTLANTIATATSFSWIDTPDIHIAYATPLGSVAKSAFTTDKAMASELQKLIPGATLLHSESLTWANASTSSILAEIPLDSAEAITFWRKNYEQKGWTLSANTEPNKAPAALIFRKATSLVRLTFESITPHTVRMSRHEVSQH